MLKVEGRIEGRIGEGRSRPLQMGRLELVEVDLERGVFVVRGLDEKCRDILCEIPIAAGG